MHWYAIQAYPGKEEKARLAIEDSVHTSSLQKNFGRIIVPTEEVVEMKAGRKRNVKRKFFPGYVLIEMNYSDDTWHLINDSQHVLGFVGGYRKTPSPLSEQEMSSILQRIDRSKVARQPKIMFQPGEVVRVTYGPFNDFTGNVEEVYYEKSRLRVALLIFGRSTPVELEFSQVEKG